MTRSAAFEEIVSEYSYVVPSSEHSVALQMGSATTKAHARLRIIFMEPLAAGEAGHIASRCTGPHLR